MYEVTSSTYSFEQLQNHNIHLPSYPSSKSKYNLIEETVRHKSTRSSSLSTTPLSLSS